MDKKENKSSSVPCTDNLGSALEKAVELATTAKSQYVTPEYFCMALFSQEEFCELITHKAHEVRTPQKEIEFYLSANIEKDLQNGAEPQMSSEMVDVMDIAEKSVKQSGAKEVDVPHVLFGILNQQNSFAHEWLKDNTGLSEPDILSEAFKVYAPKPKKKSTRTQKDETWKSFCMPVEPLDEIVGREAEIARILMILCRKEQNNPILIGESGVGKTAVARAIAERFMDNEVPERLKGRKILMLNIPAMLEKTPLRSEVESYLKKTLNGLAEMGGCVVLIENIHNYICPDRANDASIDLTAAFAPYLKNDKIAFIGTSNFDQYKRSIGKTRNSERSFCRVNIEELSESDTIKVLNGLRSYYETFHKVKFTDDSIKHAVKVSKHFVANDRLPGKAIDILDEAGAYREMHPLKEGRIINGIVDSAIIDSVIGDIYNVDASASSDSALAKLGDRLRGKVFGQDKAINAVCEAVLSAKAGLSDPVKPMASFLFVGPTGVGKTQLANELGSALGMAVQRFDMSEYSEKYTISKLLGSPAGYVGYEEGGLLTDAVNETPNCIVLLDEIEKAHKDIYNILLQIMDYGTITDAKGKKADFRNVILIMTSNAGARYASQASIGFGATSNAGAAMSKEVKNIFTPEFINRLTSIVVFNDMNMEMASRIVDAKIAELDMRLNDRGVKLEYTDAAKARLLELGYSKEYGAREIERTIVKNIRPLVVNEILFGILKDGGKAVIDFSGKKAIFVLK